MILLLKRTYFLQGTLGTIEHEGSIVCFTIELPWLDNRPRVSCVPEGKYALRQRNSAKFGQHLELANVEGRSLILIHPANDASKELLGCIAPVSYPTGMWSGNESKKAFLKVLALVRDASAKGEEAQLLIQS